MAITRYFWAVYGTVAAIGQRPLGKAPDSQLTIPLALQHLLGSRRGFQSYTDDLEDTCTARRHRHLHVLWAPLTALLFSYRPTDKFNMNVTACNSKTATLVVVACWDASRARFAPRRSMYSGHQMWISRSRGVGWDDRSDPAVAMHRAHMSALPPVLADTAVGAVVLYRPVEARRSSGQFAAPSVARQWADINTRAPARAADCTRSAPRG